MRKDKKMIGVVGLLSLLAVMTLSSCSPKTVKLEPTDETAVVADTTGAKVADKSTPVTTPFPKAVSPVVTEAAGPAESLETPVLAKDAAPDMSGAGRSGAGVVPGSRTDLGLIPVYFDYDKSLIRQDQVEKIAANALFLKANPKIKVRVEGNCDARGTNEYNLALGERRAMGTKKYLVNLGVADSRVGVLSYGEERPVDQGNDETAWAANRRGDFVIAQ